MSVNASKKIHDWIIIGGGIHGTHIAVRLLSQRKGRPLQIGIVDPNSCLLCNWKKQTASTKMKYLRSPSVHHLAPDPFALKKFAGKKPKNRRGKFSFPYHRPLLQFFNKHCESLIEEYSLDNFHHAELIENIEIQSDKIGLFTKNKTEFGSKKIILALGQSEELCVPEWAEKSSDHIFHIFSSDFGWDKITTVNSIAVVGGGITAIQTALYAESIGIDVHLIIRHSLRKHQFDSDPGWLGPKFMGRFSVERDYSKRRKMISTSRNTGSLPPDLYSRVRSLAHSGRVHFHNNEIINCKENQDKVRLAFIDRQSLEVDRVILATGFEKIRPGGNMLSQLISRYHLPVAPCGFPIVDRTLAWHPMIHVSGSLAELELGPIAKNIAGARVAADRILSTQTG